jgi:hypothetical protein
MMGKRTGKNFGPLEVLVGVQIARRQSKIHPDQQEQQVRSPPHQEEQGAACGRRREKGKGNIAAPVA